MTNHPTPERRDALDLSVPKYWHPDDRADLFRSVDARFGLLARINRWFTRWLQVVGR